MSSIFYDDGLKLLWKGTEHPSIYESNVIHGENCGCCKKVKSQRAWTKKERNKK